VEVPVRVGGLVQQVVPHCEGGGERVGAAREGVQERDDVVHGHLLQPVPHVVDLRGGELCPCPTDAASLPGTRHKDRNKRDDSGPTCEVRDGLAGGVSMQRCVHLRLGDYGPLLPRPTMIQPTRLRESRSP
jgi:hypothetical protein